MSSFQFIHEHHRPRSVFSLNGRWQLAGGTATSVPSQFTSAVQVPAVVDTAEPAYDWRAFDHHWYRTAFSVANVRDVEFLFLKIEQSMFGTDVWLNGVHLGGSISCYTSHEYPITEHLRKEGENELIVRVGAKSTLPPESAVGRDQEKEIYTPGIWGDVTLTCVGGARVKLVQVIPHIALGIAEVRAWIQNLEFTPEALLVSARIFERDSDEAVSPILDQPLLMDAHATSMLTFHIPIDEMELWSPEHPFLYEVELVIHKGQAELDNLRTRFGMREFSIKGADFFLNGHRILLRGSNIAFHRFLADKQRKLLPWDKAWITRALIDIPKEHNFNFFRNHLGQMYNRWYDIADEHGMLIQNEWQFWCATGTDVQIRKEFTEWLQDNWNHPSIIIWDPLNESSDETVQREIVPAMKELDPTRPWESVDFLEEHPYIYTLGMVMNDRQFGFARSLEAMEHLPVPSMVNEFLWWWFNDQWEPTVLTKMIVTRWMGRTYSQQDVIDHQSFLAQELIELFRRMRIKAIQPFVYISNNDGPTAHWFLGDIKDLQPKPLLSAVKNAFAPFGVSIELWDRHFMVRRPYSVRVFVFNDSHLARKGTLKFGVLTSDDQWIFKQFIPVEVAPVSDIVLTLEFQLPNMLDDWRVAAELQEEGAAVAFSEKTAYAFDEPKVPVLNKRIIVLDPSGEIQEFLSNSGIAAEEFTKSTITSDAVIMVHGNAAGNPVYASRREEITKFLNGGGRMAVIEPEFRVVGSAVQSIAEGLDLTITHRPDIDKGGYDSYVFTEDQAHLLWKHLKQKHLKMFNGAYGGEAVGQYDVDFTVPSEKLACCGIGLAVTAASEVCYGSGAVVLFRLQLRGRLTETDSAALFARRRDPVAQQLLLNLLEYCHNAS
ncbi:MAG: beta galactosidase jelly roll domain-containing protein [Bacteroidetes bacterium]|nr:beta galactosidase jelly roll domain-containing protein [Bacteroidota bacterium]